MKKISKNAEYRLRKIVRAIEKDAQKNKPEWIPTWQAILWNFDTLTVPEKQALLLWDLLEILKGQIGCAGATVEEIERWGYELDNQFEVRAGLKGTTKMNTAYGLDAVSSLFHYTGTNDLDTAIVFDFNKLVACIYRAYEMQEA